MTNRERVLAALRHQTPDKVPYDIRFTQPAHARMVEYYGDPDFEQKLGNCFTWLRPHPPGARFTQVSADLWRDEFGVEWDRRIDQDIGVVCNRLITPANVETLRVPRPPRSGAVRLVRRSNRRESRITPCWSVWGTRFSSGLGRWRAWKTS